MHAVGIKGTVHDAPAGGCENTIRTAITNSATTTTSTAVAASLDLAIVTSEAYTRPTVSTGLVLLSLPRYG